MAVRSDISVNWGVSPRVITVAAPSVELVAQDLHDTCRFLEASSAAMDNRILVQSSGFEDLGGGTKVGLTVTLQNAKVAFEARLGPEYIQCSVSGGNLVAVDEFGAALSTPISPTAFTQVVVTASSSATATSQESLEAGLFNGEVCIDTVRGYAGVGSVDGVPIGTRQTPSNNIADAKQICIERGFVKINFMTDYTILTEDLSEGYAFTGDSPFLVITAAPEADVTNCSMTKLTIKGEMDGLNLVESCRMLDISKVSGMMHKIALAGDVTVSGPCIIMESYSNWVGSGYSSFTVGSHNIEIRDFHGSMGALGVTGGTHSIGITEGRLIVNGTGGTVHVRGTPYEIVDMSGGLVTIIDQTISNKITEVHQVLELDPNAPVTAGPDGITSGDIDIAFTDNGDGTKTATRQ